MSSSPVIILPGLCAFVFHCPGGRFIKGCQLHSQSALWGHGGAIAQPPRRLSPKSSGKVHAARGLLVGSSPSRASCLLKDTLSSKPLAKGSLYWSPGESGDTQALPFGSRSSGLYVFSTAYFFPPVLSQALPCSWQ